MHLGAIRVKPNSSIKAVWQCDKCPAGQPHIWTATVYNRAQRGTQCPYCCNRLVCNHNSLATLAPKVARYWHYSRNKTTPEQVLAGSKRRAEWQCPACNFEWKASIAARTYASAGCPRCSHAQRVTHPQPTFAEAQPVELTEWDFEHNDAKGFYPDSITLGSSKRLHWICSCCPRGQPHRWTATPHCRIGLDRGCPVCAGRQACVCNSLASLLPSVAAELDVEKNGFLPADITASSNKKVWWRNAKRGSWAQAVDHRTMHAIGRRRSYMP